MNDVLDVYGDVLRRAPHADADQVAPSPRGLERVRARAAHPTLTGRAARAAALFLSLVPKLR